MPPTAPEDEQLPQQSGDAQASTSDDWTYGKLLNWTTEYLNKSGSESAQLDGQVLLAHAAGCTRIELFTSFDKVASETTRSAFRALVKQRADGAPVAYLVGSKEFYSLAFRVTPDVLVPRPETELLVVALLDHIKSQRSGKCVVADIGTGSGCIAIATAKHAPQCRFYAVDQSEAALTIAVENANAHSVADRIEFLHGDLLSLLPQNVELDFVVSNPPYVSEPEFAQLAVDVQKHEPYAALVGGPTGTELIARLLKQAAERLKPGGWLIMEISPMIESQVVDLVSATPALEQRPTIKDIAGHARVIQAQRAS